MKILKIGASKKKKDPNHISRLLRPEKPFVLFMSPSELRVEEKQLREKWFAKGLTPKEKRRLAKIQKNSVNSK